MAPRTYVRYTQIRRQGTPDVPESDDAYAKGRYFEAVCQASDQPLDLVRIAGPSVGGVYNVTKVDITDRTKVPAIGIILDKPTSTTCFVQTKGEVDIVGLIPGKKYFVGIDARVTSIQPAPDPGQIACAQIIGIALDVSKLLLEPSFNVCVKVY